MSPPANSPTPVLLTVVDMAMPPAETTTAPPLEMTVSIVRPPSETTSTPKFRVWLRSSTPASVAEIAVPPEATIWTPPPST
jgi:hypothetical protein